MIYIKPSFYDTFRCIASECTDNCCIGWEIDVDENTLDKYNNLQGDFGDKIRAKIVNSDDGSDCFELGCGDRCPFLNQNNLCDIIINCGEDYLCNICREHPRFYEWFPAVTECGLGLSCEEVCRFLLQNGFCLVEENDGENVELIDREDIAESDTYIYLAAFRESLFDVLKKDALSMEDKIIKILEKTQNFTNTECKLKNVSNLLDEYSVTEPIDATWIAYINSLKEQVDSLSGNVDLLPEYNRNYSDLLAYILYRHLIKAVYDGCIAERVCFAIDSLRFIMLCDEKALAQNGKLTFKNRVDNIKRWSKQVEYSEENTELLIFGE